MAGDFRACESGKKRAILPNEPDWGAMNFRWNEQCGSELGGFDENFESGSFPNRIGFLRCMKTHQETVEHRESFGGRLSCPRKSKETCGATWALRGRFSSNSITTKRTHRFFREFLMQPTIGRQVVEKMVRDGGGFVLEKRTHRGGV